VRILGDFLGSRSVRRIEELLVGTPYDREALEDVLRPLDPERYVPGLTREALVELVSRGSEA